MAPASLTSGEGVRVTHPKNWLQGMGFAPIDIFVMSEATYYLSTLQKKLKHPLQPSFIGAAISRNGVFISLNPSFELNPATRVTGWEGSTGKVSWTLNVGDSAGGNWRLEIHLLVD